MNANRTHRRRRFRVLPALASIAALAVGGPGPASTQEIPAGTLIIANMDDDSIWLVDLPSGERRATISTTIAPHEVTVSADGRTALVANYGDERGPGNLVQVVDVRDGTERTRFEVEGVERVHAVHLLAGDTIALATSERTSELLIVSVRDGAIRHRLETRGRGSHMTSPGGAYWYTANIPDGTVSRIDPSGDEPTETWAVGEGTEGLGAAPDGSTVWTGSMGTGEVVGVDGQSGEVVARFGGVTLPYRVAVTVRGDVVVSDPEAQEVVVLDATSGALTARIDVGAASAASGRSPTPSPQGLTVSTDGRWAFVSLKAANAVAVLDLEERSIAGIVDAGAGPDGIAFSTVR